jgi:hypothetical protein
MSVAKYYLYKAGNIVGPISEERLQLIKNNNEILNYTWVIDSAEQKWSFTDPMPKENPFQATQATVKNRELSGAFLFAGEAFLGTIQGIHAYGVELRMQDHDLRSLKLVTDTVVPLNFTDETNDQSVTTPVRFQNAERQDDDIIVRFAWLSTPVQI